MGTKQAYKKLIGLQHNQSLQFPFSKQCAFTSLIQHMSLPNHDKISQIKTLVKESTYELTS